MNYIANMDIDYVLAIYKEIQEEKEEQKRYDLYLSLLGSDFCPRDKNNNKLLKSYKDWKYEIFEKPKEIEKQKQLQRIKTGMTDDEQLDKMVEDINKQYQERHKKTPKEEV